MVAPQKRTRVAVVGMWTQSFKIAWDNTPWTSHLDLLKSLNIHWNLMRIPLKSHQKLHPKFNTPTISMHGITNKHVVVSCLLPQTDWPYHPLAPEDAKKAAKPKPTAKSKRRKGGLDLLHSGHPSGNRKIYPFFFFNRMMLSFGCSTVLIQYI